jgi:hypothetical protein
VSATICTCIVIGCDGCLAELEYESDTGGAHWVSRQQAVEFFTGEDDTPARWEISPTGTTPDLCPGCVCARDGHVWSEPLALPDRQVEFCDRCDILRRADG